ncbi:hypothetical protein F5972_08320 [Microbispora cellulosiformans]|uniref:Uncharacterized protein n=1 Tax=Microbispora cellulosiformans TaxID=2614688 RepID=A0A5J5K782_9ACTN|nr:hypothetical protein [Microbispora cellulosiformans]KAA9379648.1 hypothetical protein F5972_08320 [Microbispora cellulosiformans]
MTTDDEWSPYDVWRGLRDAHQFEVRPEHIRLLRRANTAWEGHRDVGAPSLDRRHPFGDSDDVYADMAEIVDGRTDGGYDDEDVDRYDRLRGELGLVLEIVLQAGSFEPGHYERTPGGMWRHAVAIDTPGGEQAGG